MSKYIMRAEDEFPHQPDADSNFNESVYTNAFNMASPLGGWMRLGNRVNEGYAELSVCLYLPDGRIACQFQRPGITDNSGFDAGGLHYEVLEPLKKTRMTYEGELLIVENPDDLRTPQKLFAAGPRADGRVTWTHEASSPIRGGEPSDDTTETMYGRDFSRGHFNQHARTIGEITVGDQTWQLDGRGWRDHSWGPRYWQVIYFYRLFIANFDNGNGLMILKISDADGGARRIGVLLVDGQYEEITDLDIATDWTAEQDPAAVRLGVRTRNRKAVIRGEIQSLAPLRNRRKTDDGILVSRIAEGFTRYTWDDAVGYGMTEYIERVEDGQAVGYPL